MNRSALNSVVLGIGSDSNLSFIGMSAVAVATASIAVFGSNFVNLAGEAKATVVATAKATYHLTLSGSGQATGTLNATVTSGRFAAASVTGNAVGVANALATLRAAFSVQATATGTATATTVSGTFVSSSVLARATSSAIAVTGIRASAAVTGRATSMADTGRLALVSASAIGTATAATFYATEDGETSIERQMILPTEIRNMELPA